MRICSAPRPPPHPGFHTCLDDMNWLPALNRHRAHSRGIRTPTYPTWLHQWWWTLIWIAISGSFSRHQCLSKLVRRTRGSIDVSWNWWPKKCCSNQLIAFQRVIIFQYCFIYNSARLPLSIHTPPSVEAYGPVNHDARLGSAQNNNQRSDIPQTSQHRDYDQYLHEGRSAAMLVHVCKLFYKDPI